MEQCPYGSECPQILTNKNSIELIAQKIDMQNQFMVDKMSIMADDVREIKDFMNSGLQEIIDERIEAKWNEKITKMTRWVVVSILGAGGLSSLLTILLGK